MIPFILLLSIALFAAWFFMGRAKNQSTLPKSVVVQKDFLERQVSFYSRLNQEDKQQFESDVKDFLQQVKITGIDTNVDDADRQLIASAAVIPIFYFKNWKYYNLSEVLLYSDAINMDFESSGSNSRDILGLVGTGVFEGKMLLSKHALHQGFYNKTDKRNTAIHEFVHLIDKSDGDTDGIPGIFIDQQYILPWLNLMQEKMQQIAKNSSDINPYALMNKSEFFAVAAEYFFERPQLLQQKHPKLFGMMQEIFEVNQGGNTH